MAIAEISILKELDFNKQLVFAYLTCERLYPNYVFFSKNYGFGNPIELRKAIDYLYSNLINQKLDSKKINSLISNIDSLTPQPANYDTILASSALDACGVVYESLNFLLDKQSSRLDSISTMATDTVDMYIQEIAELDFNTDRYFQQKIDNHPLMQKEIKIQSGIITFLNNNTSIDLEDIQTLLQLQESNKKSNLDL
jgi:uncharacterized protein YjaG (DUF416 family)